MNLHQQLFGCTRTQALQRGQVLDISPVAAQAFIEVPLIITPELRRSIAPNDQFRLEDPRLPCLCFSMLLTLLTHASTREEFQPFCHTVWFESVVLGRRVSLKLMTLLSEAETGLTGS